MRRAEPWVGPGSGRVAPDAIAVPTIAFTTDAPPRGDAEPRGAGLSEAAAQAIRDALGGDEGRMNALHLPLLLRLARDLPEDREPLVAMLRAINRHDAIRVRLR